MYTEAHRQHSTARPVDDSNSTQEAGLGTTPPEPAVPVAARRRLRPRGSTPLRPPPELADASDSSSPSPSRDAGTFLLLSIETPPASAIPTILRLSSLNPSLTISPSLRRSTGRLLPDRRSPAGGKGELGTYSRGGHGDREPWGPQRPRERISGSK